MAVARQFNNDKKGLISWVVFGWNIYASALSRSLGDDEWRFVKSISDGGGDSILFGLRYDEAHTRGMPTQHSLYIYMYIPICIYLYMFDTSNCRNFSRQMGFVVCECM